MSTINVVQPDELDPSLFEVVDGKMKVAISAEVDNILELRDDGLYAESSVGGVGGGLPNRKTYQLATDGTLVYDGYLFQFNVTVDGNLQGQFSSTTDSGKVITNRDTIFYKEEFYYPIMRENADGSYTTLFNFAVAAEHFQRFVFKLYGGDEPKFLVVTMVAPYEDLSMSIINSVMVIIDDVSEFGNIPNGGGSGDGGTGGGDWGPVPNTTSVMTLINGAATGTAVYVLNEGSAVDGWVTGVGVSSDEQPDFNNVLFKLPAVVDVFNLTYVVVDDAFGCVASRDALGRIHLYNGLTGEIFENVLPEMHPGGDNGYRLQLGVDFATRTVFTGYIGYDHILQCTVRGEMLTITPNVGSGDTIIASALVGGVYRLYMKRSDGYYLLSYDLTAEVINLNPEPVLLTDLSREVTSAILHSAGMGLVAIQAKHPDQTNTWQIVGMNPFTGAQELNAPIVSNDLGEVFGFPVNKFIISNNDIASYGLFYNNVTGGITLIDFKLHNSTLSINDLGLPAEYTAVLGNDVLAAFFAVGSRMGFQSDASGRVVTIVGLGAISTIRLQTMAMAKFNEGFALFAPSNVDLHIFPMPANREVDKARDLTPYAEGVFDSHVNLASSLVSNAIVWKQLNGDLLVAQFNPTTTDWGITTIGNNNLIYSWLRISQTSSGNYYIHEMADSSGANTTFYEFDPATATAVKYEHASLEVEGYTINMVNLFGDKLIILEKGFRTDATESRIRLFDPITGTSLLTSLFEVSGDATRLGFQKVDDEHLVIIDDVVIDEDSIPESINISLLKINANEITIVKQATAPFKWREEIGVSGLESSTSPLAGGGSLSYQLTSSEEGYSIFKLEATPTDFKIFTQEITPEIIEAGGALVHTDVPLPYIMHILGNVVYIQPDLNLNYLNAVELNMVEYVIE